MEAASVAVLEICDKDPSKGKARYGSKSVAPLPQCCMCDTCRRSARLYYM